MYENMKYDLFISYSRKDFEEVSAFIEKIKAALPDLTYWFDIDGIESGDEFEDKIISAINDSSYLLFALSDNSLDSQWTKDEVMYAKNKGKKIIPVLLNGARMTDWFLFKFGRIHCIDSTNRLQMDQLLHNLAIWTGKPLSEHQSVPHAEKESAQNVRPEVLCPCGSGRLFKDCHGREAEPAPEPVEKTWKVGDYYNVDGKEGVVFWVDATGGHGKIVSIDQTRSPWCTEEEYSRYLTGIATDSTNGMNNLQSIMKVEDWRNKYPAFVWCADHGAGWYLPAIEELKELLLNDEVHSAVTGTLIQKKGTVMHSKGDGVFYWSSTEDYQCSAKNVRMDYGSTRYGFRSSYHYVRAVSAF